MRILTAGTFDLFHIGHLNLLDNCKKYNITDENKDNVLIVIVDTDENVFIRKNKYPIINENDRLQIVDNIKVVKVYKTTDIDNVLIPAITHVYTSGAVTAFSFTPTSDLRLKSNIVPLANSLATVMQLNPVHYMKKGSLASTAYTREENGFIAQEIQKILPFVVTEGKDENKLLSVDYNSFIPVLTKAIQEQQKQIEDQNAKIAAQQKQIEDLIKLVKGR
jgi:cytidyltransferase-like protein